MGLFFQILLVLVLISAMALVLLGIGKLTDPNGFEDKRETFKLKEEIQNSEEVFSSNNAFHKFLDNEENLKARRETKNKLEEKDNIF